jgi:hypothetical protein
MVHRQTLPPMQSVYQPSAESQVLIPAQQRFRCMPTTWSPEGGGKLPGSLMVIIDTKEHIYDCKWRKQSFFD